MTPDFEIGKTYSRRKDIHEKYGGQQQGGISTPPNHPFIFLFTAETGERHGYQDGWNNDGVFLYSGEGQIGDMTFVRGNKALRDHATNGKDLLLFQSIGKGGGYRFLGPFDCASWKLDQQPDAMGDPRNAIIFHLLPLEDTQITVMPENKSLIDLRKAALAACSPYDSASTKETRRIYYERSAKVRAYVLARAAGNCESCGMMAPFFRDDDQPYLEPHHIRRVSDGGLDHPSWVAAVCPNCHKEAHYGKDRHNLNSKLRNYVKKMEG